MCGKIDRLYLSHFDRDHVNSIQELIDTIGVKEAVIPYVPMEYRVVYDVATGGAYSSIRDILSRQESGIHLIEPQDNDIMTQSVWEWIAKSMITKSDWTQLTNHLVTNGIQTERLHDPNYVASVKDIIKQCCDSAYKSLINAKGLILLSQKTGGTILRNIVTYRGKTIKIDGTAALYLGDADAKTKKRVCMIKEFLKAHLRHPLVFVQIPHHGSQNNSSPSFDNDFPACFYYYHDLSSARLRKNAVLFNNLSNASVLLDVTDVDSEKIEHVVEIL